MWSGTVGLVNSQHKYLTAETFGHKINANGAGLKKKQQWSIEPYPLANEATGNGNGNGNGSLKLDDVDELEHVAIKSHLNCYLAVDSFGNVTCDSPDLSDGARFTITICSMTGDGPEEQISWAFKNLSRGYYLGATSEGMIQCNAKMPQSKAELWHVHLTPARGSSMFALKSIGRKRYARTSGSSSTVNGYLNGQANGDSAESVQVDATSPWGPETLFQFKYFDGGKYALLTSGSKFLTFDGTCVEKGPVRESLFTIEYHGGHVAFRDYAGRYLAAAGRASVLRTRSSTVSKDELFEFEPAPVQVAMRAGFNNRFVSIKQGVDVSANQSEVTTKHETFQLEFNSKTGTWNISTIDGAYWTLGGASTIQVNQAKDARSKAGHFRIKWAEDGSCSILAGADGRLGESDMKWICGRKSGQLYTASAGEPVKFFMRIQNRTSLNLRASSAFGFVGLKQQPGSGGGVGRLDTNKTTPDSVLVEYANSDQIDDDETSFNCVYLKMSANNKYLSLADGNSVAADASSPACAQQWQLELRTGHCLAVRTFESPAYLNLTNNGALQVGNCAPEHATLWEF